MPVPSLTTETLQGIWRNVTDDARHTVGRVCRVHRSRWLEVLLLRLVDDLTYLITVLVSGVDFVEIRCGETLRG